MTGRTRPAGLTVYEHRQGHRPRSPGDPPPADGPPRTAFVLADDAALGAMQAGMVHALYERGIVPDLLIGTSAGALNAAFLASRPQTAESVDMRKCQLRMSMALFDPLFSRGGA